MYVHESIGSVDNVVGLLRLWSTMAIEEHYFGDIVVAALVYIVLDYVTHGVYQVFSFGKKIHVHNIPGGLVGFPRTY